MKTKLLRKIRRKYEVLEVVRPEGWDDVCAFIRNKRFKVTGFYSDRYCHTKQEALDYILRELRLEYNPRMEGEYRKVWYNKNV